MRARGLVYKPSLWAISLFLVTGLLALPPLLGAQIDERLPGSWELYVPLTLALTGQSLPALTLSLAGAPAEGADGPPAFLQTMDPPGELVATGSLQMGSAEGEYAVVAGPGELRLLFALSGSARPRTSRLWLVEAPDIQSDLLLLADEPTGQVLTFRRESGSGLPRLSPLSEALVTTALHGEDFADAAQARDFLAQRRDWSEVVDHLMEALREDPDARNNNLCLTLQRLVEAHLPEVHVDIGPLLESLASPIWTNRQKCGWVVATLAGRPELFEGRRSESLSALIRLLPSQRGRVVEPALAALQALTGESFGRDLEAWLHWFQEETGRPLDLRGAAQETLILIRPLSDSPSEEPKVFVINGERAVGLQALVERVADLREQSPLPSSVVLQLEQPTTGQARVLPAAAEPVIEALRPLDLPVTLAPVSDRFYPPYRAAWPE